MAQCYPDPWSRHTALADVIPDSPFVNGPRSLIPEKFRMEPRRSGRSIRRLAPRSSWAGGRQPTWSCFENSLLSLQPGPILLSLEVRLRFDTSSFIVQGQNLPERLDCAGRLL